MTVLTVRDASGLQALAHPLRVRALEQLREPGSAAEVARRLGEPRQKLNYHLKELVKAGLVAEAGERRSGNFVETLYRAVANAFVISPEVAWGGPRRAEAMRHQLSLEQLVALGERLQRDAVALLDRAAFDGETIASASVVVEVGFATEEDRAGFLGEYLAAVRELTDRYGTAGGTRYLVATAAYPDPREEG